MLWIGRVRSDKFRRDFVTRTFALVAPDWPVCTEFSAVTNLSQMHPNNTKYNKTWVQGPMVCIGWVPSEKFRRDFVTWTFALIALVRPILHRVYCSNETIPNAPKQLRNARKHEFWVPWCVSGAFIGKNSNATSWHKLFINCSSSAHFSPSLVQ